jgi:hypothetical protein
MDIVSAAISGWQAFREKLLIDTLGYSSLLLSFS